MLNLKLVFLVIANFLAQINTQECPRGSYKDADNYCKSCGECFEYWDKVFVQKKHNIENAIENGKTYDFAEIEEKFYNLRDDILILYKHLSIKQCSKIREKFETRPTNIGKDLSDVEEKILILSHELYELSSSENNITSKIDGVIKLNEEIDGILTNIAVNVTNANNLQHDKLLQNLLEVKNTLLNLLKKSVANQNDIEESVDKLLTIQFNMNTNFNDVKNADEAKVKFEELKTKTEKAIQETTHIVESGETNSKAINATLEKMNTTLDTLKEKIIINQQYLKNVAENIKEAKEKYKTLQTLQNDYHVAVKQYGNTFVDVLVYKIGTSIDELEKAIAGLNGTVHVYQDNILYLCTLSSFETYDIEF